MLALSAICHFKKNHHRRHLFLHNDIAVHSQ